MSGAIVILGLGLLAPPAALPVVAPGPAIAAFVPVATAPVTTIEREQHDRAVHCLAAAISYEAGSEPIEGQEAVAQVVLNRLQDPAYPKSVCGVVFQGSTRRTGCQFTFTCDGSLRRLRSAASMARASEIAERALRGELSSAVGSALNYHADYVAPKWAPRLIRVAKIGAHIFYRPPASGESPRLLSAAFVGDEDDSRLPDPAPVATTASYVAPSAIVAARGSGAVFAPWGLQTLAVSKTGAVRAITPTVSTGL